MATVTLHIGAVKTGTSYVQAVLSGNRQLLADRGVCWPGEAWSDQVHAVNGLRGVKGQPRARWDELVAEIDRWPGPEAVVSMEFLSLMTQDKVDAALDSLARHRVRVVLTARDIGRAVPAQWQESVKNGYSWPYAEYLAGVTGRRPMSSPTGRHFWGKQDWPRMLEQWASRVAAEDLVLAVVPQAGAPRGLLWERFCQAAGLAEPAAFTMPGAVNESIGAASAELMREVMRVADERDAPPLVRRQLKAVLANRVLAAHRPDEQAIVLPEHHRPWAEQRSEDLVARLRTMDVTVVGDLDELLPRWSPSDGSATSDPSTLDRADVVTAAAVGLVGLAEELASAPAGRSRP